MCSHSVRRTPVYFWLQFEGLLRIGRWFGFLRPADPEVSEMARELARYWQRPEPSVWLFSWGALTR